MAEFKTDSALATETTSNIYTNTGGLITGDADQDLRLNVIYSKVGNTMFSKLLKEYNVNWNCKGATYPGRSTPSTPTAYDAYICTTSGTCFGVASCTLMDVVWYTGAAWSKTTVDLNDYYYTKAEVDALISGVVGGGQIFNPEKQTGVTIATGTNNYAHSLATSDFILQIKSNTGEILNFTQTAATSTYVTIKNNSVAAATNCTLLFIKV